jgi:hypothetical protein
MQTSFPFAVEPVVYDFAVNENGTVAELRTGAGAILSIPYYLFRAPADLRQETRLLTAERRAELARFAHTHRDQTEALFDRMIPRDSAATSAAEANVY